MTRDQVEHVPRAAAAITLERSFVVLGSQAILLAYPDAPEALLASREVDLYPAMAPEKSDLIDGSIGALSQFDETFGYYADGVGPETAVLPGDWMARAQLHYIGDVTAICPEVHDLAVSKCVAGREKDADFIRVLLHERMIVTEKLLERLGALDAARCDIAQVTAWARLRISEAIAA